MFVFSLYSLHLIFIVELISSYITEMYDKMKKSGCENE